MPYWKGVIYGHYMLLQSCITLYGKLIATVDFVFVYDTLINEILERCTCTVVVDTCLHCVLYTIPY